MHARKFFPILYLKKGGRLIRGSWIFSSYWGKNLGDRLIRAVDLYASIYGKSSMLSWNCLAFEHPWCVVESYSNSDWRVLMTLENVSENRCNPWGTSPIDGNSVIWLVHFCFGFRGIDAPSGQMGVQTVPSGFIVFAQDGMNISLSIQCPDVFQVQ